MTTRTLKPANPSLSNEGIAFVGDDARLLCSILNRIGGGGVYADESSLPYFTVAHVRRCLQKVKASDLGAKWVPALNRIRDRVAQRFDGVIVPAPTIPAPVEAYRWYGTYVVLDGVLGVVIGMTPCGTCTYVCLPSNRRTAYREVTWANRDIAAETAVPVADVTVLDALDRAMKARSAHRLARAR